VHALTLVVARQLVRDLEFYSTRAQIYVVPPLRPLEVSFYDYMQRAQLIDRATQRLVHGSTMAVSSTL
jgi:NTE family protein